MRGRQLPYPEVKNVYTVPERIFTVLIAGKALPIHTDPATVLESSSWG